MYPCSLPNPVSQGSEIAVLAGRGRRPLTLPPTKTPLLRPYPLLERLVGPKGGPLRQSVMLSGNIVNIVRGPGILVLYRGTVGTASLLRSICFGTK